MGFPEPPVGKRGTVRFGLEQLRAGQFDDQPIGGEIDPDERLELFSVNCAPHRREPVGVPDAALGLRPLPDGLRQRVGEVPVHRHPSRAALRQGVVDIRIHQLLQDRVIQHTAVDSGQGGGQGGFLRRCFVRGVRDRHYAAFPGNFGGPARLVHERIDHQEKPSAPWMAAHKLYLFDLFEKRQRLERRRKRHRPPKPPTGLPRSLGLQARPFGIWMSRHS